MSKGAAVEDSNPRTVRELIQKKFLDEVIGCTGGWKVLVMDKVATRVISSALTMYDIMERRVTIVEKLEINRQPFQDMDVIYLASPTADNARRISADFENRQKAKYGHVHIFFLEAAGNDVFGIIQSNPLLVSKIKTFKEIYLDFLATESILFHLDQPEALEKVYGSLPDPAYAGVVGKRLVNLCISLNEHPCIRYQGNSAFAREVATALHQGLLQFKRTNSAFWCYGDDRHNEKDRGQFLILDRSFDPLSPLIHDFTYQAMAYDLLDISEGVYNYNVTTGKGSEERVALLNESDEFWVEHRYSHIAKVVDAVRERMLDIVQNEPAAQIAKKNATDVDISSLSAVVKQLPQYNQMMTKISQHVELSQKCMKEVNGQNLINVSQIESTISTGSDEDGSEVKGQKLLAQVVELFKLIDSSRISTKKELKTRVLAIYYVSQRGIPGSDEFIRQAVQAANLGNDEKQLITNFERILAAAQITAAADEKGKQGGIFSAIFGGAKVIKHAATAEGEYIESRHVPLIKLHLEQLMNGNLPLDKFPAMGPSVAPVQKSEAKSVRRFGAASRFGKKENVQFTGGRFMVFVTGGATFNEARYAYELMNKEQKEVIFGSTHIMTPSAYLTDVGSLHRPPASQSRVATTHDRKEANL